MLYQLQHSPHLWVICLDDDIVHYVLPLGLEAKPGIRSMHKSHWKIPEEHSAQIFLALVWSSLVWPLAGCPLLRITMSAYWSIWTLGIYLYWFAPSNCFHCNTGCYIGNDLQSCLCCCSWLWWEHRCIDFPGIITLGRRRQVPPGAVGDERHVSLCVLTEFHSYLSMKQVPTTYPICIPPLSPYKRSVVPLPRFLTFSGWYLFLLCIPLPVLLGGSIPALSSATFYPCWVLGLPSLSSSLQKTIFCFTGKEVGLEDITWQIGMTLPSSSMWWS